MGWNDNWPANPKVWTGKHLGLHWRRDVCPAVQFWEGKSCAVKGSAGCLPEASIGHLSRLVSATEAVQAGDLPQKGFVRGHPHI